MNPRLVAAAAAIATLAVATAQAAPKVLDLTHPIPTYKPMANDPMKADMNQPWGDARRFPSFGPPAILAIGQFPTSDGHFDLGTLTVGEHHGTHVDTPGHYINNKASMEAGGIAPGKRKLAHQLTAEDLIGRVVLIDISGRVRVQAELDKNGGKPSPDKSVTDFSNASANVVGADDIAAVADKLQDGDWLVLNFVGDEQGIAGDDRLQRLLHALCVEGGQGVAEGRAGAIGGNQDRHLLAREAAFAGLAAAPARLAIQLPLPLPALENEGLVRLAGRASTSRAPTS